MPVMYFIIYQLHVGTIPKNSFSVSNIYGHFIRCSI